MPPSIKPLSVEPLEWLKYGLTFALLWILLTGGDANSWMIGVVVVPLATWCALRLFQPGRGEADNGRQAIRISALPRFMPFFLRQSLQGGWESALFAIHPGKRLHSGFIRYTTSLPEGRARLFFTNTVSLLPGTVSADWRGDTLTIHALDTRADHYQALRESEDRIAALFGLKWVNAASTPTVSPATPETGG